MARGVPGTGPYSRLRADAQAVAQTVIAAGGSVVQAADAVQERFGNVARNVAYELSRNISRGFERARTAMLAQPASPVPAAVYEPVAGGTFGQRFLVSVTYTGADGEQIPALFQWVEFAPGETPTLEEINRRAGTAVLERFAEGQSPEKFEEFEESLIEQAPEFTIHRAQQST